MKPLHRVALLLLGASSMACQDPSSSLCDEGQILDPVSGYCVAAPVDAGWLDGRTAAPDARADGSMDAARRPDAGGACDAGSSAFKAPCAVSADCRCPTNYCAVTPGSTTGFCTRTGCDVDPTICPATWTCLDLGTFQTGLPHICYQ